MVYNEIQPPIHFSKHVECYWEMLFMPGELDEFIELLMPTCTFNIIFTNQSLYLKTSLNCPRIPIPTGATFIGQRSSCISFFSKKPVRIFGIRFKPFAFANIIKTPIYLLNDQFLALDKLFDLNITCKKYIQQIATFPDIETKTHLVNNLLLILFDDSFLIDQPLRAQLNFILDRKGMMKVNELFSEFGISKVTLRKHFINKVGLPPKKISRIWRMNYFLQLKEKMPNENLTSICLMAGFYDQAHFIKEFKSLLGSPPREFFQQKPQLLKISMESISRRFTNQYDPRV
ncbi:MAG: DUF6597 domain-containing transcriptional factor [Saprospiraceae bacterium]